MKFYDLKWVALSMLALASCSDKENNGGTENPEGPQGSGTMEVMTPEQSKEYLQQSTVDFLNKFKPEDQKAAIELAGYYSETYGDFEAPVEFDIEPDGNRTPAPYLRALAQAAKGDMDALTRAAVTYNYTIRFDRFTGVYEPDMKAEEWKQTGKSDDIIFKFNNKAGQPVELKVSQSGGVSDLDFTLTDWDYDYNPSTGDYEEVEEKYNYFLSVPKNVIVTLTENGKEMARSTVVSSIDVANHTLAADVQATLMNLRAQVKVSGNDKKVEARSDFYVSNDNVGSAYATVTGNDLCNKKKYESFEGMDDDQVKAELAKMLQTGDCGVDMLGKVQAYGQVTYYKELPDDLDFYADEYDYPTVDAAMNACKTGCARMNKNIKTQLRYDNTKTDQASLVFNPYKDEWNQGQWWEVYPIAQILFPDGTTYDIDSYFEGFTNVSNKWDTLFQAYENIWNLAAGRK